MNQLHVIASRREGFTLRRLAIALATILLAMAALTAARANAEIAEGVYKIMPAHALGAKAIEVPNLSQSDNAPVVQNTAGTSLSQRWRIKKTGQSPTSGAAFYSLSPQHAPDKCLEPLNGSTAAGARVVQFRCSNARTAQRWHIFVREAPLFQITNRNSSMALQVPAGSLANGVQLRQNTGGDIPELKHKMFGMTKLSN
jgi:hypothetical protein